MAVPGSGAALPPPDGSPEESEATAGGPPVGLIIAAAVFFLLVAAGVFIGARALGGSGDEPAAVRSVRLVAADDPGPHPFLDDGLILDPDRRRAAAAIGDDFDLRYEGKDDDRHPDGLRIVGTPVTSTGGDLYASAPELATGVEIIHRALDDDAALTATWAEAMGIGESEVPDLLDETVPVITTQDVMVTEHGLDGDDIVTHSVILESGTPLLLTPDGVPAVSLVSGNPLTPPEPVKEMALEGDEWDRFDPEEILWIEPVDEPAVIEIPDLETGERHEIDLRPITPAEPAPVAGKTELTGYLVADDDGVFVLDEAGERTRVLDHPVALVFDDGAGGLIYQLERSLGGDFRNDVHRTNPADDAEATIWHLRAGETEPVPFRELEPGDWHALHDVGTDADGNPIVFYSRFGGGRDCSDTDLEGHCIDLGDPTMWVEGPDGDARQVLEGYETFAFAFSVRDGTVAVAAGANDFAFVAYERIGSGDPQEMPGCEIDCARNFGALLDAERWLSIDLWDQDLAVCTLDGSADGGSPCRTLGASLPAGTWDRTEVHVTADRATIRFLERDATGVVAQHTQLLDLDQLPAAAETGSVTLEDLDLAGRVQILTAPILRPT